MNHSHPSVIHTKLVGMRLSLCCLVAVLSACGGGADDAWPSESLSNDDLALTATLHDYCNVTSPIQAAQKDSSGVDYSPWSTWNNSGLIEQSGSVYAWGHAEVSTLGALYLQTNYRNYADVVGQPLLSSGATDTSGMGVAMSDVLPDQAVGCVRSVAHPVFSARPESNGFYRVTALQWSGRATGELSMAAVGDTVRNGFEFAANFATSPDSGFVYFNVPKTDVDEPATTRICHLGSGSDQWVCHLPVVLEQGALWSLRVPGAKPGVYVLANPTVPSSPL